MLTPQDERIRLVNLILEAQISRARLDMVCKEAMLSKRTYRLWYQEGKIRADLRPTAIRPDSAIELSDAERKQVLDKCNEPEFASLPLSQIVPTLLDKGVYIA